MALPNRQGGVEVGAVVPAPHDHHRLLAGLLHRLPHTAPHLGIEQITVEVGSGIVTPEEGAKLYDQDVKKEALQLGLPGW